MDESMEQVLQVFAEMGKTELDLHVLFEAAGNEPAARQKVLDLVEELEREGYVEARSGDFYALTKKGSAEVSRMSGSAS